MTVNFLNSSVITVNGKLVLNSVTYIGSIDVYGDTEKWAETEINGGTITGADGN